MPHDEPTTSRLPAGMARLNKMLYLDTKFFLADHNLNYTDKMSMAHGIEVRVPLLDYAVVRHAGALDRVHDQATGHRSTDRSGPGEIDSGVEVSRRTIRWTGRAVVPASDRRGQKKNWPQPLEAR